MKGSERSLTSSGAWYLFASFLQLGAAALLLPIITRALTSAELGVAAVGIATVQVGTVFFGFGLPAALSRLIFEDDLLGPIGAFRLFALHSRWVLPIVPALGLGAASLSLSLLTSTLLVALMAAAVQSSVALRVAFLRSSGDIAGVTAATSAIAIAPQLFAVGLAAFDYIGPVRYVSCYLAGALVALVEITWRLRRQRPADGNSRIDGVAVRLLALPALAHGIAAVGVTWIDRPLIAALISSREAGRYQVAYAIGSAGIIALGAVNSAWGPRIYSAGESWFAESRDILTEVLSLVGAGCTASFLILRPLLGAVAPESYDADELYTTSSMVLLSSIPYAVYLANTHALAKLGDLRPLAKLTPVVVGINVVLNLVLLPILGINGAAVATGLGYAAWALLSSIPVRRATQDLLLSRGAVVVTLPVAALVLLGHPSTRGSHTIRLLLAVAALLVASRAARSLQGFSAVPRRSAVEIPSQPQVDN